MISPAETRFAGEGKSGDEANIGDGGGPQRRYRVRRQYEGYYRGSRRSGLSAQQQGDNSGEGGEQGGEGTGVEGGVGVGVGGVPRGGGRGRGGPSRRFLRRNFRGGRGGGPPRRPRSQDGQVKVRNVLPSLIIYASLFRICYFHVHGTVRPPTRFSYPSLTFSALLFLSNLRSPFPLGLPTRLVRAIEFLTFANREP